MLDNMTSDVVKQYIIYGWCHPVQEIGTHEFPTMTKCTTQDYTTNKIVPTTLYMSIKNIALSLIHCIVTALTEHRW